MSAQISRVVLVQNHLAELGGITRFCSLLSQGLTERGYDVEIVALSHAVHEEHGAYLSSIPTTVLVPGLAPHETRSRLTGRRISGSQLKRALASFETQVQEAADSKFAEYGDETVVIFTQLYARERIGTVADVEARRGRFHLVAQYHNSFIGGQRVNDVRRVKNSFDEADLLLSLTEQDAELFQKAGMNNTSFILNPMAKMRSNEYKRSARNVVSLGRYDEQKSLDHLIRAWHLIGEKTAGWTLELYGDGPERAALERLIDEKGLTQSVRLMGSTNQAMQVLADCAFSVQSSQYEGLPLALMESSALGVPCVAYNCAPGVELIIQDDVTGFLAGPNEEYELANRIALMMESADRRAEMGRAGREWIEAQFSMDSVLDEWERAFSELVL